LRREIRSERPLMKTVGGDGSLGAAAMICGEVSPA
jgi:hypothetical protein